MAARTQVTMGETWTASLDIPAQRAGTHRCAKFAQRARSPRTRARGPTALSLVESCHQAPRTRARGRGASACNLVKFFDEVRPRARVGMANLQFFNLKICFVSLARAGDVTSSQNETRLQAGEPRARG